MWHSFDQLYDALGRFDSDHGLLRARLTALDGEDGNQQTGVLLIALGDHTRRVNSWRRWLPAVARFRQSPEFSALMQSTGILAYWQQEGFPPHCRESSPGTVACD